MPYFCFPPFVWTKQYWEGKMSLYLNITFQFLDLLCFIWKFVEHNQLFFCLTHSFLFTLTLTLCTLFNFLYVCSFMFDYLKGYINSGITHCMKTLCFVLKFYQKGCVARANTVLHVIRKNIRLIWIF